MRICEAIAVLEVTATREAEEKAVEARRRIEERRRYEAETGVKPKGRGPIVPDVSKAVPSPKTQSANFVDPESRLMMDGATKGFIQGYNTQNAVDSVCQIVVATSVIQEANDKQQLVPMALAVEETTGQLPERASADSGYCSAANLTDPRLRNVDFYVAVARQRHHETETPAVLEKGVPDETESKEQAQSAVLTPVQLMELKLSTPQGKAEYAKRKCVVEPVHGQVKEVQRARRFQFRGLKNVNSEWRIIMMGHNILKLFRHARDKVLELIRSQTPPLCYSG